MKFKISRSSFSVIASPFRVSSKSRVPRQNRGSEPNAASRREETRVPSIVINQKGRARFFKKEISFRESIVRVFRKFPRV